MDGHTDTTVREMACHKSLFASASYHYSSVRVWDLAQRFSLSLSLCVCVVERSSVSLLCCRKQIHSLTLPTRAISVCFSQDGRQLYSIDRCNMR
jgi:WD40 repeat protein